MDFDVRSKGVFGMLPVAWQHVASSKNKNDAEIYQTSLMSALINGVYEGQMTYGELRKHGDFGLGTFNDLDGEMVGFDGDFYQVRSDGTAMPVTDCQKTPFAVVAFFKPDRVLSSANELSKDDLFHLISKEAQPNLFTGIRIDGRFDYVRTRTVGRQEKPFGPLTTATQGQAEHTFHDLDGTLAGFLTPQYAQGVGVAGFHVHFLRSDKSGGGHVQDYYLKRGTVRLCTFYDLHIDLPTSEDFLKTRIDGTGVDQSIKAAEG